MFSRHFRDFRCAKTLLPGLRFHGFGRLLRLRGGQRSCLCFNQEERVIGRVKRRLACLPLFCGHPHPGLRVSSAVCILTGNAAFLPERIPFARKVRGSIAPPRAGFRGI